MTTDHGDWAEANAAPKKAKSKYDPSISKIENLYWDLVEVLGDDEEVALHLTLDLVDEDKMKKLLAETKERLNYDE